MGALRFERLLAAVLCASCAHHAPPKAESFFISGKAYACADGNVVGKFAAGRTVRLLVGDHVLAEAVVGSDGSYVLHPRGQHRVSGPISVWAGGSRLGLAHNYASWMQDRLRYEANVQFGCGPVQYAITTEASVDRPEPPYAKSPLHEPTTRMLSW